MIFKNIINVAAWCHSVESQVDNMAAVHPQHPWITPGSGPLNSLALPQVKVTVESKFGMGVGQ